MYIKREMDWDDIKENAWAGAVQVIEDIEAQGREDEAMTLIEETFFNEVPDETQVNDFIWFDLDDMMALYDDEEEEEDEEDYDDEEEEEDEEDYDED